MGNSICSGNDWAVGANIQGVAHPEKPGWGSGVWGDSRSGASEHLDDVKVSLRLSVGTQDIFVEYMNGPKEEKTCGQIIHCSVILSE